MYPCHDTNVATDSEAHSNGLNVERDYDETESYVVTASHGDVTNLCHSLQNSPTEVVHSTGKKRRAKQYLVFARLLTYILLIMTALALEAFSYVVHRVMTFPDEAFGYTNIMPSFVLISGQCDHIGLLSDVAHLLVNIIDGVRLGISNYLQQICISPTDENIFIEVRERGDVMFGDNSLSSLVRRMSRRKSVCIFWVLLLLTSLPAHLLLNGSVGIAPTWLSNRVAAVFWDGGTVPESIR